MAKNHVYVAIMLICALLGVSNYFFWEGFGVAALGICLKKSKAIMSQE
jgi:NADH:ubiquinone oxidoreductase subunit 6 (subunit J)